MAAPRGGALTRPVVGATLPVHWQHDAAQILIGLVLQGDAAYDDAFAHFQRLSQFNGETSAAQVASFKLGELPFEQGQYQFSARHWQRFLNDVPQSPLAPREAHGSTPPAVDIHSASPRPARGAWRLAELRRGNIAHPSPRARRMEPATGTGPAAQLLSDLPQNPFIRP